MSVMWLHS